MTIVPPTTPMKNTNPNIPLPDMTATALEAEKEWRTVESNAT
jgi:hypothetical protein